MTSPVSIAAYRAIPNLEERQRRVMDIRNVRSRVGELLKQGEIYVSGEKVDRITGHTVRKYRVMEAEA